MSLRIASKSSTEIWDVVCAFSAKNAYLLAFMLLVSASGILVFAVRDRETGARNADSVLVLGTTDNPTNDPVFSIKEGSDDTWWVSISAAAKPGQEREFEVSSRSQTEFQPNCFDTGRGPLPTSCQEGASSTVSNAKPAVKAALADCSATLDPDFNEPRSLRVTELPVKQTSLEHAVPGGSLVRGYQRFTVAFPGVHREDASDDPIRFTMTCRTALAPMRNGWSDRSIQIWADTGIGNPNSFRVDLSDLTDRASLIVTGGDLSSPGSTELNRRVNRDRDALTVRWRDESKAWLKDVVLLAIGALLGVAGACLIEWVRPWFETKTKAGT